jgi:hypothetical protein
MRYVTSNNSKYTIYDSQFVLICRFFILIKKHKHCLMGLSYRKNAIFNGFEYIFRSKINVAKLNDNTDSL